MDVIDYWIGQKNCHLIPLRPDTKKPYAGSWKAHSVNDVTTAKLMHAGMHTIKSYSKKLKKDTEPDFTGCIWGLDLGESGLCAVDIDVGWHEKEQRQKEGLTNFNALKGKHGPYPNTFAVKTPSGGFHVITEGVCASGNSKLAKDIDVKSSGGYIVAPGTVTKKGEYKVFQELPFAPTPKWILDTMGQQADRKEILAVVGEEMTEAERAKLIDALKHLDPSMKNDPWVKIGQGIHHSFPGQDGLEVWTAWSRGDYHGEDQPANFEDDCEDRWDSFTKSEDQSKDITIASVFHEAIAGGWEGPQRPSAKEAFADTTSTPSYSEQLAEAAAHGNPVAVSQEAVLDPDAFIEMQTMNEVIREAHAMPPAKRVFDDLVFEGEITILFSRANVGKTALGMQIAGSIASGNPIDGFVLEATDGEKILYWDFELSKQQVGQRYDHDNFDDNLIRCAINRQAPIPINANHSAIMYSAVERSVVKSGVKKIVIDNLTYMGDDLAEGAEALQLMKRLKDLKERYGLTMLIDAHTPKIEPYKAIHLNHLAGSANLGNFIDACFAIGEVKGVDNLRYLKQLKVRSTGLKYGAGNVILCELTKAEGMLKFVKVGNRTEQDLIKGSLSPDAANSVPNQRRDYIKTVMANLLELDKVVTMKGLAQQIAKKSLATASTREIFNEGSEQRVYGSMREMCEGMGDGGSVWFDVGDGLKVEFFKSKKRLSSAVTNCHAEYGVQMVKEAW